MGDMSREIGILHGVIICVGTENSKMSPVGDHEGTRRPTIVITPDCSKEELFETVCYVRGRYDIDRELSGLQPFEWGESGNWNDVHELFKKLSP